MIDTEGWQNYLETLAQIAGTLFALVIAARGLALGIRRGTDGAVGARERRYLLLDSVSTTYELAAAALLALMAGMPKAHWFLTVLPVLVAAVGIGLVVAFWIAVGRARRDIRADKKTHAEAWVQAVGSLLPFACYVACLAIWVDIFLNVRLHNAIGVWKWPGAWMSPQDVIALAVTWLTISGAMQAIWWYRKTWANDLGKSDAPGGTSTAAGIAVKGGLNQQRDPADVGPTPDS